MKLARLKTNLGSRSSSSGTSNAEQRGDLESANQSPEVLEIFANISDPKNARLFSADAARSAFSKVTAKTKPSG